MIPAQECRDNAGAPHPDCEHFTKSAPSGGASSGQRWRVIVRLSIAVLGLVSLAADVAAAALPLIVVLVSRQMPARTVLRRLALAVIALFGFNAALLTILAVLGLPVAPRALATIYLLGFALAPALRTGSNEKRSIATASDWWALGTALTVFSLLYRPFVGASLGRRMAQLSFSTDGAHHLAFVRRSVLQGGYLTESNYPQAWAGNVALIVDLVGSATPDSLLLVAPVLIMAFYALMVFFAVALSLDVLRAVVGNLRPLPAGVAVGCIALTALVGPGNLLIRTSSYTQTVAIAVLLATAGLLTAPDYSTWRLPTTLGLFAVALMQTWYLLAPVLAMLLLLYLVKFRPRPMPVLVVATATVLLSAYPLLKGPPPVTQLNAPGVTPLPQPAIVLALLLLTLVALAVIARRSRSVGPGPLPLISLVVATLLLLVAVIAIQVFAGAGLRYYAAKVLYVVLVFGGLAGATAAGLESEHALRLGSTNVSEARFFSGLVVTLVLLGLAGVSVGTREQSWPMAAGQPPNALNGAVLDAIFSAHPNGLSPDTDAWVFDACSRGTDYLASKWIHDLFQTWNESRHEVSRGYRSGKAGEVKMLVDRAADNGLERIEIYTHRPCMPDALARISSSAKVVLVTVP